MEGIQMHKRPRLRNPYMIVAWPGMGEVAFKAAMYLVKELKAEEFASMRPENFFYFTTSTIKNGILKLPDLPFNKFYYWKNKTGRNETPSIPFGCATPAASSTVGIKSMADMKSCLSTVPGLTLPGQLAIHGVRVLCR